MPTTDYYNFANVNLNDNSVVNIATGVYDLSRNGQSNLSIVDTYTKFGKPSLYRSTPDTTAGTNYYYTTATMSTSFTFAFWIRTIGGSSSECAINILGDTFKIGFYLSNGNTASNSIKITVSSESGVEYIAYLKTTNLTAGKTWNANDWNHVAFIASYNGTTTSINIYYNGSIVNYEFVSQGSGLNTSTSKITAPKNATDPIIVSGPMFTNNSVTMYIGGSPNNYGLVCYLSNIFLFNSALSSTELKMLINNNSFNTSQYGFNVNNGGDVYINGTMTCNLLVYELNNGSVFPVAPSAYLISGNNINPLNGMMFPIFGNITDYSSVGISNMDYAYYVMPGYTLIVYNEKWYQDSTPVIIDNSTGVYPLFNNTLQTREGAGKSCKVSYLSNRLLYFTTPPQMEVSALNGTKLTFTSGSNTYIHYVFTSNTGKLTLNNIYTKYLESQIKALVVGGGGSGGGSVSSFIVSGGGGGGDVYFNTVSLTAQSVYETLDMVIGNGGAGVYSTTTGNNGGESKIAFTNNPSLNITCKGGGGGGSHFSDGKPGGSGGGGCSGTSGGSVGTNSYNAYSGGAGTYDYTGGGGGGAAASGGNGITSPNNAGGNGGNGYQVPLYSYGSPTSLYFGAGGGGGATGNSTKAINGGNGGTGGGGGGIALPGIGSGNRTQGIGGGNGFSLVSGSYAFASGGTASINSSGNGLANSGSGGGGDARSGYLSGSGGSGIVIIIFTVATENMSDFIFN